MDWESYFRMKLFLMSDAALAQTCMYEDLR